MFVSWSLDEYRGLFPGRPAADEAARRRRIDGVDVHGSVATATMTLARRRHLHRRLPAGPTGAGCRIANQAYYRHT
ncbi:nuclear transport factor 2 family protein [Streptomyces werraensis]